MASVVLRDTLSSLPREILENIFQYLVVEDLCHVTLCSRSWREAANSDVLWRPLCRKKGWERYSTVTDLCKEVPLAPASQEQDEDKGSGSVSFQDDLVVTASAWPGLTDTCKWKEIYMKARHLEANWRNNRYHVVSFEFGSAGYNSEDYNDYIGPGPDVLIRNMDGEGNLLACGVSDGKVRLWDVNNGQCRHVIEVDVSDYRHALKMKNGVIAVGCKDGKIRTYSTQTGEQLHVLSGHRLEVTQLFFDGETIVSAAQMPLFEEGRQFEDSDIRVWSSADGSSRFVFQSVSYSTSLVHLDYLDKTVAVAYSDNTIRLWDVLSGTCRRTITTGTNKMISCHLGDGIVISVSKGNDIKMWNLDLEECIKTFDVPGIDFKCRDSYDATESCAFSGELLLAKTSSSNIRMFNLDGKFVGDTKSHPNTSEYNVESICIHGNKLVTHEESGGNNYLWTIDRRDGFTLVEELRRDMYDDEVDDEYTMAWMSDTKLAFVHYYDSLDHDNDPLQIPKILVHHYW